MIKGSNFQKFLGIKIDYKLIIDNYVNNFCEKDNNILEALARPTPYMNNEKRKLLINFFLIHKLLIASSCGC